MKRENRDIEANILAIAEIGSNPKTAAEHYETCIPAWHIVRCQPGHERIAAASLAGHRFGIYLPERKQNVALYPGYLFVWVSDISQQHRRIRNCVGVTDLLCFANGCAAIVSWDHIDRIRRDENVEKSIDMEAFYSRLKFRHVRRRRSRKSKRIKSRRRQFSTESAFAVAFA